MFLPEPFPINHQCETHCQKRFPALYLTGPPMSVRQPPKLAAKETVACFHLLLPKPEQNDKMIALKETGNKNRCKVEVLTPLSS